MKIDTKRNKNRGTGAALWFHRVRWPSLKADALIILLIVVYVALFTLQINQPPLERYPHNDHLWTGAIMAGKLVTLNHALSQFELPSLTPYIGLGWNIGGDPLPVSFLSPPNLLILFLPTNVVITLRTMFFLAFGGVGAYLFLHFITRNRWLSFLGGLAYISLPAVISLNYHYSYLIFYPVPFFLLLIHKILEQGSFKKDLLFIALSILAISSGNIHTLLMLPSVVAVYTFLVAYAYYGQGLFRAVKKAIWLVLLCVMAGSFYIVPLYDNARTVSSALSPITGAGLYGGAKAFGVKYFFDFFYQYGIQTLYKPNEGSALLLYLPVSFYFVILTSLVLKRLVFQDRPRQAVIPLTLVVLGLLMFLIGIAVSALPQVRGQLRIQINLIPFVNVLAGFICLAAINQLKDFKKQIYTLIFIGSFVVDWLLFCVPYPPSESLRWFDVLHSTGEALRQSSNRVSVRFLNDMWLFLPWLNLSFLLLPFAHSFINGIQHLSARRALNALFVIMVLIFTLLNISVHNELKATQQVGWQVGRSAYFWESYLKRKACIDKLIDRRDPNYRTLPASDSNLNKKLIIETEMNAQDHEKMLFAYREVMHPYTGLLYSTFGGQTQSSIVSPVQVSGWFPPDSARLPYNVEILKLMGVKWVISADREIHSPHLIYRGECFTEDPPFDAKSAGGTVYVYEVREPLGIAFLADDYQVVSFLKSLRSVFQHRDCPWSWGVVNLETDPVMESARSGTFSTKAVSNLESRAEIVNETFNSIEVKVGTPTSKWLVLSYLYRPNWKAYAEAEELKIYRAYGGLMAVQVPPGHHTITFRYTPVDVYLGLLLTGLAFCLPLVVYITRSSWESTHQHIVSRLASRRARAILLGGLLLIGGIGLYAWFGPCTPSRLLREADALFETGRYLQALKAYRGALTRGTATPETLRRVGVCYEECEELPLALETYMAWTQISPGDVHAWLRVGWLQYQLGHYEQAIYSFAQAVAIGSANAKGYKGQVLSYFGLGRYPEALEFVKKWARLEPDRFGAHLWLGLISLETNDYKTALTHFSEAEERSNRASPDDRARLYYGMGRAYYQQGQIKACNMAFAKAEAIDPTGELLTNASRKQRDGIIVKNILENVLLQLDFSEVVKEGNETYAVGRTGHKAKVEGPARVVDGVREGQKALMIEGVTNYTRVYGPPPAIQLNEGSLAVWARLADLKKEYSNLVTVNSDKAQRIIYIYRLGANGKFVIKYNDVQLETTTWAVGNDQWHHYAFTWKNGERRFYIDGKEMAAGVGVAFIGEATQLAIGWLGYRDGEQWHGPMAEFVTFDRALTHREIVALYRVGLPVSPKGGSRGQLRAEDIVKSALLHLDFSEIVKEGDKTYALARTGQQVEIAGAAQVEKGPRADTLALVVGENTRVYGPSVALNLNQGALTVWARLTNPRKVYSDLVSVTMGPYIYHQGADGRFVVFYNNVALGKTSVTITDDQWHHYAFTWKDGEQKFYVDGREVLSGGVRAVTAATKVFAIGWLGGRDGEQWGGWLADVATFVRALTAREIAALYHAGLSSE